MIGWLGNAYLWVKAAHVVFMIFWMAGMFALPRFLVYHQEAAPGSPEAALWVERETKLRHIILTPSITLTWIFGLMLAANIRPKIQVTVMLGVRMIWRSFVSRSTHRAASGDPGAAS